MKKLDFAKYYDITDIAKAYDTSYETYEKVYICVDTWDFWIARIQKGFNTEYEKEEGSFLLERNKVAKEDRRQGLRSKSQIEAVLEEDDFGNWDVEQSYSEEDLVELLDAGFGIGELV